MKTIQLTKWVRVLALLLFVYLLGVSRARSLKAQNPDNGLLWEISGNGLEKSSYLFGTYHLLHSDYLTNWPLVLEKAKECEGVVVETVVDNEKMAEFAAYAFMPEGKLSDLYSEEEYRIVNQEVKEELGVELKLMDGYFPAALSISLVSLYAQRQTPKEAQVGGEVVDLYFAKDAEQDGKTVTQLESMEWQIKLLYQGEKPEKQAEELLDLVKEETFMEALCADLITHYLNRDLYAMHEVSERSNEVFDMGDEIVEGRNATWMTKLPTLLQGQSQFIAVGALHLPGPEGLIELLRSQGYTVTAIY